MATGWVITIAVFIFYFIGITVSLANGGKLTGMDLPNLNILATGFGFGLICSGIFVLYHSLIAGCVLLVIAALFITLSYSCHREWRRQQELEQVKAE